MIFVNIFEKGKYQDREIFILEWLDEIEQWKSPWIIKYSLQWDQILHNWKASQEKQKKTENFHHVEIMLW